MLGLEVAGNRCSRNSLAWFALHLHIVLFCSEMEKAGAKAHVGLTQLCQGIPLTEGAQQETMQGAGWREGSAKSFLGSQALEGVPETYRQWAGGLYPVSSRTSERATAPVRTQNITENLVKRTHVQDRTSCWPSWWVLEHQDCRYGRTCGLIILMVHPHLFSTCSVPSSVPGVQREGTGKSFRAAGEITTGK